MASCFITSFQPHVVPGLFRIPAKRDQPSPSLRLVIQKKDRGAAGSALSRLADYSTLNLKNAALSSGANSTQMLPSTTDTESGFRVRGNH